MENNTEDHKKSTIIWLVLFFPVGLYKMWKNDIFDLKIRAGITALFAFLAISSQSGQKYDHYKQRAIQQNIGSLQGQLDQTRKSSAIGRIKDEIRDSVQAGKSLGNYLVEVEHKSWKGHELLSCNVNGSKASCGVYEVVENAGQFQGYWVNGKGKNQMGHKFQRTPSSIDPSKAYQAVK